MNQRLPRDRLEGLATEARRAAADLEGEAARCWTSLADQVSRRVFMGS
jgi:hypothetical protein